MDIDIELMDFNEIHITITYPTMAGTQADTLYVRDLTIEGTVLTVTTSLQVTREDTVSKQRYRPKTRGLRNTWIRSVADMENRADAILDAIASPERRVQLDYLVEDWAVFLSLDLSDRVRVVLPTVESDAFIESIGLSIRRGGAYYSTVNLSLTGDVQAMVTPPVTPPVPGTPWEEFEALTDAWGIEFEADTTAVDLYEFDPAEGTLLNATAGQHVNTSILWIERVRVTATSRLEFHRGDSNPSYDAVVGAYADSWTVYIVNETDGQFIALQANDTDTIGGGFVGYASGSWALVGGNITSGFDTWLQGLVNKTVITGYANDATWEPYS